MILICEINNVGVVETAGTGYCCKYMAKIDEECTGPTVDGDARAKIYDNLAETVRGNQTNVREDDRGSVAHYVLLVVRVRNFLSQSAAIEKQ